MVQDVNVEYWYFISRCLIEPPAWKDAVLIHVIAQQAQRWRLSGMVQNAWVEHLSNCNRLRIAMLKFHYTIGDYHTN